ncbi:MAG: s-methyl-5-thioribose-1-phosphate isomerase [Nitriliruptorales bacterium]|nr:s-methyl-5-thioribose-1-phosphate isomerase [Nitriliruptorales bacterium]
MNDPRQSLVPTLVADSVRLTEDGVDILDRRVFPLEKTWVHCATVEDVAVAIEEMVTQSSGPYFAAAFGMVLAARQLERRGGGIDDLERAAQRLVATRPTNNLVRQATDRMLQVARSLVGEESLSEEVETAARRAGEDYLERSRQLGRHAATLFEDGDAILTHCWGESYVTEAFAAALRAGKDVTAVVTETRPYLQGARLTAESLAEIGVDTTVITDGMGAWAMARGRASRFVTAADRVTLDGHVVNKIGTLQLAIAARHHGVPYHALIHEPDAHAATPADVPIEERDGDEVLHVLGTRTASERATGWYPAFDVTPPDLVTTIVTSRGPFAPDELAEHDWRA